MQRYLIYFSYDGSAFHGFQVQPDASSVQAEIERALSLLLRRKVEITGAGRTDAGVHARGMTAHFDVHETVDIANLAYRLNRLLPQTIAVEKIAAVAADFHARFSARRRTYHYYVHTLKDPFLRQHSLLLSYPLDFAEMNAAAKELLKTKDFAAFAKSHTDAKTTLCEVYEARWIQTGDTTWYFRITANRFLRGMVRAVVGTLIEVGRGKMSREEFKQIIASGDRSGAGESMPARALFLESVEY